MKVERPTKPGDEPVGRALVEVLLRAHLPHGAIVHDHEPVGHRQGLLLVVRDHDGGEAELLLQLADLDAHLLPQLGVEVGQRLVEQQHVGPEDERARQRHPLLLAARKLARQALAQMLEADQPQGLGDAAARSPSLDLAHLQPEGDVLRHRQMREERVALEHQAGVALPRRQRRDVALAQPHVPAGRLDEARDDAQRRRLAAAGRPQQHHELAVGDVERDVAHRMDVAVALGDAIDLEAVPCALTPPG